MNTWRLLCGDVRDRLKDLPDNSVHCVVTSPPYWGLRDYGTAKWEGGDPKCKHTKPVNLNPAVSEKQIRNPGSWTRQHTMKCATCGAVKMDDRQIGLEKSPEDYVAALVETFKEVRRVLRKDGVCWLNLGDSYNGSGGYSEGAPSNVAGSYQSHNPHARAGLKLAWSGLKVKDLVGIPWRVAFALQKDGWWLRSDVIWSKINTMPESVTDRPTKAHEYVFMLTKSDRYFYDYVSILVKTIGDEDREHRNRRSVWEIPLQPVSDAHFATYPELLVMPCIKASTSEVGVCPKCGAQWERIDEEEREPEAETLLDYWSRTCEHRDETPVPATVLDPFNGSGTTGIAALKLRRSYIGIDLSEEYIELARKRLASTMPLFSAEERKQAQNALDWGNDGRTAEGDR